MQSGGAAVLAVLDGALIPHLSGVMAPCSPVIKMAPKGGAHVTYAV